MLQSIILVTKNTSQVMTTLAINTWNTTMITARVLKENYSHFWGLTRTGENNSQLALTCMKQSLMVVIVKITLHISFDKYTSIPLYNYKRANEMLYLMT